MIRPIAERGEQSRVHSVTGERKFTDQTTERTHFLIKTVKAGASLAAQGLRLCDPMRGIPIRGTKVPPATLHRLKINKGIKIKQQPKKVIKNK